MSPNRNYESGRRLEYEVMRLWKEQGYAVARSSGSHGIWDVCAVKSDRPVDLIQCKVTEDMAQAKRMLHTFAHNPPLEPSACYHQVLIVKVKGSKELRRVIV